MPSHYTDNDQALIAACLEGSEEAWVHFDAKYRRLIAAVAARAAGYTGEGIDDDVAHVYEKLLEDDRRRLRKWRGTCKFSTYLAQVARNLCIDRLRQRIRRPDETALDDVPESAAPGNTAADQMNQDEEHEALRNALNKLPEKQAKILSMRMQGRSIREIAQITGMPVGTVSVENSRALARLRKLLENPDDGPAGSKR